MKLQTEVFLDMSSQRWRLRVLLSHWRLRCGIFIDLFSLGASSSCESLDPFGRATGVALLSRFPPSRRRLQDLSPFRGSWWDGCTRHRDWLTGDMGVSAWQR
jgi:hypothetical protein